MNVEKMREILHKQSKIILKQKKIILKWGLKNFNDRASQNKENDNLNWVVKYTILLKYTVMTESPRSWLKVYDLDWKYMTIAMIVHYPEPVC